MGIIEYICKYLFLFHKSGKKNVQQNTYDDISDLLARFVINNYGKKIGESVAIYHDLLIIKQKKTYLGIPMKHVAFEGKKLLIKGLIDSSKAKKLGNDWKKSTYKEITYPEEEP